MERDISFLRQKRLFVFACALLVFAIFVAFAPSLSHPFMSDDYHVLAALAGQQWDARFFFTGSGKYLIPVTKLLWTMEYALFGTEAQGYHFVSLLLHLLTTALVVVFFSRLFKSQWSGLLTGAFFALSASHWRTAMWMSAQMKMLAAFFLLVALFAFFSYLRTGKRRFLLATLVAQIGMPFSSALGMELPFVLVLLYFFLKSTDEKHIRVPAKRAAWTIASLFALCLVYVCLQYFLYAHSNVYFLSGTGLRAAFLHLFRAGQWLFLGLFEGFGHSMTGYFIGANPSVLLLHAAAMPITIRLVPLGLLFVLLLLPRRRGCWMPILLFAAWTVLLYAPPILPDLSQGLTTDWFVTRARYFYVPAIPAAALLTTLLTSVRPPKRRPMVRVGLATVLVLFGAAVLLGNLQRISLLESYASDYTKGFARVRDAYVQDLTSLLRNTWGTRVVTITDVPLGRTTGFDYAGHNVLPSHLAQIYLSSDERASFRFLPEGVSADYVVTGQGTLWPPVAGR
ncbi:MAG: hypothetical protein PHO20_05750 [Candidatus Peribacteraceae bacterium]|nr:hypothetical protein [Candidatus Peribacteraceae bacterium]MDD5740239.1 hypothetical protein [Candidatus Peribacteraceae bacterium]